MPKVLVIDDDRTVRHLISRSLGESDFECITAATEKEGLRKVSEEQPDVVLLDIILPGSRGKTIVPFKTRSTCFKPCPSLTFMYFLLAPGKEPLRRNLPVVSMDRSSKIGPVNSGISGVVNGRLFTTLVLGRLFPY